MTPHNEAGAIIAHYIRQLTQAAGLRWTEHNERDMARLAELLAEADQETIAPFYKPAVELPAEPPAATPQQLDSRVTVVLDQPADSEPAEANDLDDPNYQRWRQRQREAAEARRLIQREARR